MLIFLFCSANSYAKINVFACEPEWASLVQILAGDRVKAFSATTALQDPHHIQARPSLIAKARRADLLICTGAELETGWLPLLLRKSANRKILPGQTGHFMASDHVLLLEKPKQLDRSQGDVHADGNPHIHLDPHRIMRIAEALSRTLSRVDADNQADYQNNWISFKESWSRAIAKWEQLCQSLRGKQIVVNHNSWVYLEDWLKLKRLATLEPKPGIAPGSTHLAQVLVQLKDSQADMILYASYQNDKAVRWLEQKTHIPVVELPFSVSTNETLFEWYDRIINQLLDSQ
ncbi:MAG: zinc ABC transporter substrate-binding protein [gamma proteobacterium symbiont of Bathyaustriella thionipta]|nr:zinc ABC transporter substrate-binding protein [gamma proteobacterium symbiont of Bathyaustriella thionipta]MCU7951150.1 zinc ABC transporter substrate-binding protein [gamma proteobacterium symbiont of Bathyaustriella thionipta]MCU7952861.1 zinc ABC transporter substrate-binding protein [gamma proteobacterium symbiont of Bathyaustriella thionipta]MCU7957669.1 zinc ABC transporter substrate-binding protein [gamma proteobacterium symbiont of Bathyaustriella thionipta]MCU7968981.1 zinc ABC tra